LNGMPSPCDVAGASSATPGFETLVLLMIFFLIIGGGIYVIFSILTMKIFKKFNIAGWKAWVPFVNTWTFLELGGQHGWWQFIPIANFIFIIIAAYNIGTKLGKDGIMIVLYLFIPIVWFIIMALKSAQPVASASGEIGIGGLGVNPDQAVFAKPNAPVSSDGANPESVEEASVGEETSTEEVSAEETPTETEENPPAQQ